MKQKLVAFCLTLFVNIFSTNVYAQANDWQGNNTVINDTKETRKGLLEFTDYVGVGFNRLDIDGEHPYKNSLKMELAFGARYFLSDLIYTEGLIDFSNYRYYDLKDAKDLGYIFFNTTFYNIDIPVHLGVFIPTTAKGGLCLYLGPTICFNLYSKSKYNLIKEKGDKTIDAETETVYLGLDMGFMYNFGGAAVGLNYRLGATELSKKTKENSLTFRLQYNIPLKKSKSN